jgi:hypothetical protein
VGTLHEEIDQLGASIAKLTVGIMEMTKGCCAVGCGHVLGHDDNA